MRGPTVKPEDEPSRHEAAVCPPFALVESAQVPDLITNPHSAVMDLAFYDEEMFPERYQDRAFVALKGSRNRTQPTGYKVVFVPFADGRPDGTCENFLTGFRSRDTDRAEVRCRSSDVTVAHDGALIVIDDAGGTIRRVTYDGKTDAAADENGKGTAAKN